MSLRRCLAGLAPAVLLWLNAACGGSGAPEIDLLERLNEAEKRGPNAPTVVEQTINSETIKAIYAIPPSRIIWKKLRVPQDAWLRTSIALKPEAWNAEGDGVLFRIGVSDGRNYEQLLNQQVNPRASQGDRRWIPVNLDLSAYSDQDVDVIFNLNASPPQGGVDRRNDFALWGAPQIYVR